MAKTIVVGDLVVFRKAKRGTAPSPRAINLRPAEHGDEYGYEVEKYWRVMALLPGGQLEVITRRGKKHTIDAADSRLRRANIFERWFLASRFPPANPIPESDKST